MTQKCEGRGEDTVKKRMKDGENEIQDRNKA